MKKIQYILLVLCCTAGIASARTVARFGVITDIHHTNKSDSSTRKYSASLAKTQYFIDTMNTEKVDFVIELGDFVDTLVDNKDPLTNLNEVEDVFTSFDGPTYHVLGNHEFDNVTRDVLLPNLHNTGIPTGQTYYSFDVNSVHCVVLDADYTIAGPHPAFDMKAPGDNWWSWQDAWIPQEELNWLKTDLADSNMPTVIFVHQVINRDNIQDHTIKNADALRQILENDGQVVAAFSGHDHKGEISVNNGIHYFVLEGNVGTSDSEGWEKASSTNGTDPVLDNPFSLIEIEEIETINGQTKYDVRIMGNAQQYTYMDQTQYRN